MRIAESSTGPTSQPKVIGNTPKFARDIGTQMFGTSVAEQEKKDKFLIYTTLHGRNRKSDRKKFVHLAQLRPFMMV